MNVVICPHCKKHRMVLSKVPRDAVAVMPCPACNELAVLFRDKVIPLNREIIEHGSFDDRKNHLAGVIAEFLGAGIFPTPGGDALRPSKKSRGRAVDEEGLDENSEAPISAKEVKRFITIDLKCIDDPSYFKRHLG